MSVKQTSNDAMSNKKAALTGLYDDLYSKNMFPFWATSEGVDHVEGRALRLEIFRHRTIAAAGRAIGDDG